MSRSGWLRSQVWEHLPLHTAVTGARQLFMALRPGGHARIAVPDWHMGTCAPTTAWVDRYGGVPPGCDGSELTKDAAFGHEVHYTRELLTAMMEMAGLVTTPVEWHDTAGRLHQRRCDRSPSLRCACYAWWWAVTDSPPPCGVGMAGPPPQVLRCGRPGDAQRPPRCAWRPKRDRRRRAPCVGWPRAQPRPATVPP